MTRKSRPKQLHEEHMEVAETPTGGVGLTASVRLFTDPKIVEPVRDAYTGENQQDGIECPPST